MGDQDDERERSNDAKPDADYVHDTIRDALGPGVGPSKSRRAVIRTDHGRSFVSASISLSTAIGNGGSRPVAGHQAFIEVIS